MPIILLIVFLTVPAGRAAANTNNDPKTTVSALEQDVKDHPGDSELWVHLGLAYRDTNDIQKAQSAFEKALSLNPRNANALFMLGLLYEKKGQQAEALRTWRKFLTIETDPTRKQVAERHIHQLSQ